MPNQSPEADIRDIKGLFELYGWYRPGLWIFILILVAAGLLFFWYRRRHKKPKIVPPKIVEPPGTLALLALEKIRPLAQDPNPKPFHFGLSDILRNYVEGRFGFPATDRTSEEIKAQLSSVTYLDEQAKSSIFKLLETTDTIKFTDTVFPVDKNLDCWEQAKAFVLSTGASA